MSDSGIVYNATTGATTMVSDSLALSEAVDIVVDYNAANETIAILQNTNAALNQQINALMQEIVKLQLIASIKEVDPNIDSTFVTSLNVDQLTALNQTLTRIKQN